jgi:sulfite reductase beta subunit-like hemoprotein
MNLVKVMHELSVNGDPSKLPHEFEVDISTLVDNSSSITVADIKLPAGVELYHITENDIIMSVVAQSTEDLSEAVVAVDMDAIDVEKKGKKEEGGEEPAAA